MAVIRFTDADKLASVLVPTEWYKTEITEIDGPKKSSSEKSFNFFTKIQIIEGPYTGKELTIVFNTGTKSPSVLGTAQFMPHSYFIPVAAAILNVSREQVPQELDLETIVRKPFDCKIEKGIHEGVPMNTILTFLPAGMGKDQAVPF